MKKYIVPESEVIELKMKTALLFDSGMTPEEFDTIEFETNEFDPIDFETIEGPGADILL